MAGKLSSHSPPVIATGALVQRLSTGHRDCIVTAALTLLRNLHNSLQWESCSKLLLTDVGNGNEWELLPLVFLHPSFYAEAFTLNVNVEETLNIACLVSSLR